MGKKKEVVAKESKKHERMVKQKLRKQKQTIKYGGDNWRSEWKRFENYLAQFGLFIKDVTGDGNCLFRAFSDQVRGSTEFHQEFRKECVDYIKDNKDFFAPFVEDDVPFEKYVSDMYQNGTWGGNMEIQAMSVIYGVNVIIHQLDLPRWEVRNFEGVRFIHLSYHSGDHYASVRPNGNWNEIPNIGFHLEPIKIGNETSTKNSEKLKEENDVVLTEAEKLIIRSVPDVDVSTVREALEDLNGNVEETIEYLIEMSQFLQESEHKPLPEPGEEKKKKENVKTIVEITEPPKKQNTNHTEKSEKDRENWNDQTEMDVLKNELDSLLEQENILKNAVEQAPSDSDIHQTLSKVQEKLAQYHETLEKQKNEQLEFELAMKLILEEQNEEKQKENRDLHISNKSANEKQRNKKMSIREKKAMKRLEKQQKRKENAKKQSTQVSESKETTSVQDFGSVLI